MPHSPAAGTLRVSIASPLLTKSGSVNPEVNFNAKEEAR